MRAKDIQIGGRYIAKVSGREVVVRVLAESSFGGWTCVNTDTGRQIRVKSAQRFRRPATAEVLTQRTQAVDVLVRRGDPTQEAPSRRVSVTHRYRATKGDPVVFVELIGPGLRDAEAIVRFEGRPVYEARVARSSLIELGACSCEFEDNGDGESGPHLVHHLDEGCPEHGRFVVKSINEGTRFKTKWLVLDNAKRGRIAFGPFDAEESAAAMQAVAVRRAS